MKHTPKSAAKAVRSLLERTSKIAKTWADYQEQRNWHKNNPKSSIFGEWANFYGAYLLVCEQLYGAGKTPTKESEILEIEAAIAEEIPELFADYWESLPLK